MCTLDVDVQVMLCTIGHIHTKRAIARQVKGLVIALVIAQKCIRNLLL